MTIQKTLSIIKPNAVKKNKIGSIISMLEEVGLKITDAKMARLENVEAQTFYREHEGKPFFEELIAFMTSGPIVVMILEGKNAIHLNREVMGQTNPAEAKPGSIRAKYGDGMTENAVHGSDGENSAKEEIRFFFG